MVQWQEQETGNLETKRHILDLLLVGCGTLGECPNLCALNEEALTVSSSTKAFSCPLFFFLRYMPFFVIYTFL